jgi:hypothetical protein
LKPDPARQIMPLGERVQRLAVEKGLRHLALELDAAGLLWRMGFHPSKARLPGQFHFLNLPGPSRLLKNLSQSGFEIEGKL